MEKQTMGKFIQSLRKAKGYSQQSVAEMLGVSNKTISSWECDNTTPDLYMLPAIAELYEVSVDELIKGHKNNAEIATNVSDKIYEPFLKNMLIQFNNRFTVIIILVIISLIIPSVGNALWLYVDNDASFILDIIFSSVGLVLFASSVFVFEHYNISKFMIKTDIDDDSKYKYIGKALKTNMIFFLIIYGVIVLIPFVYAFIARWRFEYLVSSGIFILFYIVYIIIFTLYIKDYKKKMKISKVNRIYNLVWSIISSVIIMLLAIKGQSYLNYKPIEMYSGWRSDLTETLETPKNLRKLNDKDLEINLDDYTLMKTIDYSNNSYKAYVLTSDLTDDSPSYYAIYDTIIIKNEKYIGTTTLYMNSYRQDYDIYFIHLNMNWTYKIYSNTSINISITNVKKKKEIKLAKVFTITLISIVDIAFVSFAVINYIKRKKD